MKKPLLILLLLWQFNIALAQTTIYHPFPTTTAVWRSHHTSSAGTDDVFKMQMQGDTILGGFACKKIYDVSTGFYYKGALRQDIANKKVYYTPSSGAESLLYNFDLAVGDTIKHFSGVGGDTLYVESIDSTLVGTDFHKMFVISGTNPMNDPADLIEGVGYTSDLFWNFEYTFENVWTLECFSIDNSIRLFPTPGGVYQCYMTVGIGELKNNALQMVVTPNPLSDEMHIVVNCNESYDIEIRNNIGDLVLKKMKIRSNKPDIDFWGYANGVYFVRLIDSKGNSVVKKIVKQ